MSERDEIIYESYLAAHMALQEGSIERDYYAATMIYNIMLHDLNGIAGRPVEIATEQVMDEEGFTSRVNEVVAEFLGFAVPNTYASVEAGFLTQEEADEQIKEMMNDLLDYDFVDRVVTVADTFIEELGEYSDEEIAAAVLFGCHPEVLREASIRFVVDDAVDFSQES